MNKLRWRRNPLLQRLHTEEAELGADKKAAVGRQIRDRHVVALELAPSRCGGPRRRACPLMLMPTGPTVEDVRQAEARNQSLAIELRDLELRLAPGLGTSIAVLVVVVVAG